jgi:ankyrin repeat protein
MRDDGLTPLYLAIASRHEAVVKILLEAGARDDGLLLDGMTSLNMAVAIGDEAVVRVLLGAGIDVNKERDDGITALFFAVTSRNEAMVTILLEAGARVDKSMHEGTNLLELAVALGNEAMVVLLHSWNLAKDDPVQQYFLRFSKLPTTLYIVNPSTSPISQLPTEVLSRVLTMPPSGRLLSHQVRRLCGIFEPRVLN